MAIAFVIGNGISRRGIDLLQLQQLGHTYGCNALYREFLPNVLVATDKPIADAINLPRTPKNAPEVTELFVADLKPNSPVNDTRIDPNKVPTNTEETALQKSKP